MSKVQPRWHHLCVSFPVSNVSARFDDDGDGDHDNSSGSGSSGSGSGSGSGVSDGSNVVSIMSLML